MDYRALKARHRAERDAHHPSLALRAHRALAERDTVTVLGVVLSRIYTLRNQLMHGGATWTARSTASRSATAPTFWASWCRS